MTGRGEVCTLPELLEHLRPRRASGETVVFTNGVFDLIHPGHVKVLRQSKALGHILVVGMNSDASVRRLKGENRPILSERERAKIMAALEPVDYVVLFEEDTPAVLVDAIVPDVLVKGGDYDNQVIVGRETVEAAGGRVITVPLVPGRSTTDIVSRVLAIHEAP